MKGWGFAHQRKSNPSREHRAVQNSPPMGTKDPKPLKSLAWVWFGMLSTDASRNCSRFVTSWDLWLRLSHGNREELSENFPVLEPVMRCEEVPLLVQIQLDICLVPHRQSDWKTHFAEKPAAWDVVPDVNVEVEVKAGLVTNHLPQACQLLLEHASRLRVFFEIRWAKVPVGD